MKKLHSFTFYTLFVPAITLGAGSALAQEATAQDKRYGSHPAVESTQRDQEAKQSTVQGPERNQSKKGDSQSRMQHMGYMDSAPANGLHANNLIGADVTTLGGEEVGPVNDLVIDKDGQVVAIVVGVGGFLGLGEKDVALGWDDVTKSSTSDEAGFFDEIELQIDQTREELTSAPDFETRE